VNNISDTKYELELFKIVTEDETYIEEFGWVSDTQFFVWIRYYDLDDFMARMKDIFGYSLFDDGGFDANMQYNGVCIDLCEMLGDYLDLEDVFPKGKYQH
jgi:hypothetical protein